MSDEEILRLRRVGDETHWKLLQFVVERMMRWGFSKTQIYEFIRRISKE